MGRTDALRWELEIFISCISVGEYDQAVKYLSKRQDAPTSLVSFRLLCRAGRDEEAFKMGRAVFLTALTEGNWAIAEQLTFDQALKVGNLIKVDCCLGGG